MDLQRGLSGTAGEPKAQQAWDLEHLSKTVTPGKHPSANMISASG